MNIADFMIEREKTMITKTYNVLDVEDVERIVSEHAGRNVKIGEMTIELLDCLPEDSMWENKPPLSDFSMYINVEVDGEDIVTDEENYESPLQPYLPEGVFIPEKYFFNFDTKLFKSYKRYIDNSD